MDGYGSNFIFLNIVTICPQNWLHATIWKTKNNVSSRYQPNSARMNYPLFIVYALMCFQYIYLHSFLLPGSGWNNMRKNHEGWTARDERESLYKNDAEVILRNKGHLTGISNTKTPPTPHPLLGEIVYLSSPPTPEITFSSYHSFAW